MKMCMNQFFFYISYGMDGLNKFNVLTISLILILYIERNRSNIYDPLFYMYIPYPNFHLTKKHLYTSFIAAFKQNVCLFQQNKPFW